MGVLGCNLFSAPTPAVGANEREIINLALFISGREVIARAQK